MCVCVCVRACVRARARVNACACTDVRSCVQALNFNGSYSGVGEERQGGGVEGVKWGGREERQYVSV